MAVLHLEAKKLSQKKPKSQTKFLMPKEHRFAGHQCSCCGTLVCRGTAVGNHCRRAKFILGHRMLQRKIRTKAYYAINCLPRKKQLKAIVKQLANKLSKTMGSFTDYANGGQIAAR